LGDESLGTESLDAEDFIILADGRIPRRRNECLLRGGVPRTLSTEVYVVARAHADVTHAPTYARALHARTPTPQSVGSLRSVRSHGEGSQGLRLGQSGSPKRL